MTLQDRRDQALVRRAFIQFALLSAGLIVVVVLGLLLVVDLQAEHAAGNDAATSGDVVAAAVEVGLGKEHKNQFDEAFTDSIEAVAARAGVRAVVVWDSTGTVVWSTRLGLTGRSFGLDPASAALFDGAPPAVADAGERLDRARPSGLLGNELEVFSPITNASGDTLVVESYVDRSTLPTPRAETIRLALPLGVGALVLFEGLALLAGAQLARRVKESRRERVKLLTASLAAVDHERRRLAHDLHDGIIQDLAAMRYALTAVMYAVPEDLPEDPRARLVRVNEVLGEELVALRSMLGELLPVDTQGASVAETLRSLVERLVPPEVAWSVDVDSDFAAVDPGTVELIHRVVREGVRNAVRHAGPAQIAVRVDERRVGEETRVVVVVDDDGAGRIEPGQVERNHFGLRLLSDLVQDNDGDLQLLNRSEGGARLSAEWRRLSPEPTPGRWGMGSRR